VSVETDMSAASAKGGAQADAADMAAIPATQSRDQARGELPYLVMIKSGIIHYPSDNIEWHAKVLAEAFDGAFWFAAAKAYDYRIGRVAMRGVAVTGSGALTFVRAMYSQVAKELAGKVQGELKGRRMVFIAYDPYASGLVAAALAKRFGGRLVIEMPGDYASPHIYADEPSALKKRLKRTRNLATLRLVLKRADAIRLLKDNQLDGLVSAPKRARVRNYFDSIDTSRFEADPEIQDNTVMFAGFPFRLKGVDVLIDAWKRVREKHPDWRLRLVGHELRSNVSMDDMAANGIEVLKALPNIELADHIKACGIFVLPSRTEAMGRVLLEAAAAGRARLASRVGGIPRVITHERDGLLVEPENPGQLAEALDRLMSDRELRLRLGRAAQERINREFTGEAYRRDLIECVGDL